jgi:hypothetical protein
MLIAQRGSVALTITSPHRSPARAEHVTTLALHRRLANWNRTRLKPSLPTRAWRENLAAELDLLLLEGSWVEQEQRAVSAQASAVPRDPDAFVAWFEQLNEKGPGQGDPLFPWLAHEAPEGAMRWFLEQELGGEAGFEDLVALTQIKLSPVAKLELARNYWDEMGQGHASGMHAPMLAHLANTMAIRSDTGQVVWESLALNNLMIALATNRRYAYHSIGALGAIELTAPARAASINAGLHRLEIAGDARHYFTLHATLDITHSQAWNREVLRPLVAENPDLAPAIAEGALLRLTAAARCFERYRRELAVPAPTYLGMTA